MLTVIAWIAFGVPAAALVTLGAGRLLGARRGWLALIGAGVIGFAAAVVTAGMLTDWGWTDLDMILLTLVFGLLYTMAFSVGLDLIAPIGSLAKGEQAGLIEVRNPVAGLRERVLPFRRYKELIAIARRNGVGRPGVSADSLPAGIRQTLEEAGGLFVKLGQVASTRTDVLPSHWCDELAQLRSAAAPAPESVMRPHIAALLGAEPEELFDSFDWTPLASGSISQVYRATCHDGHRVVVKVERPGLEQTLERDSAAVMQLAQLIERRTPLGLSVRPADLAEEFLEGVREELDFRIEAANAAELRAALAGLERARIPEVRADLSGRQIITQELIDAPSIDQLSGSADHRDPAERIELANRLVDLFMHQIFGVGVFHADPHPGNIMVEADGTIVLIDLGAVGRLGPGHRDAVLEVLAASSTGDASGLRQALARVTVFDRRVDIARLEADLGAFLARHLRAGGGITATAFEDIAVLIGRFGIRLPRWFGTLSRTLVTLEGTIKGLDPSFSLVDAAKRRGSAIMGGILGDDPRQALQHALMTELPRLRRVPERLDDALGQLVSGRLSAQLSVLADERDIRLVTRLADRLVLAIVAAALLVSSVLLLRIDARDDGVGVTDVFGYFGLGIAIVLGLRIVAGVIRDGET